MTRTRRRRLMLVGLLLGGLALASVLALTAFRQNLLYFYEPSDVLAGKVPAGAQFRIGGLVSAGSVKHADKGLLTTFRVADCGGSVPVQYSGILPDLFREGQGIVAHGRMDGKGNFVADEVLAKHDENYMPPEVEDALKDAKGKPCMPTDMTASRP